MASGELREVWSTPGLRYYQVVGIIEGLRYYQPSDALWVPLSWAGREVTSRQLAWALTLH